MTEKTDAAAVPTTVANRFYIFATNTHVRVSFGESYFTDVPTAFHTAVLLSAADARSLADLIENQLLEAEKLAK